MIELKIFPPVPYKHLNMSSAATIARGTRVFHVAKEFGPSSMGGLGAVLTALAKQQQHDDNVDVSVILPFYSLTRHLPIAASITSYANLSISVYPGKGYGGNWQVNQAKFAAQTPHVQPERAMQEIKFGVYTMPYWIDDRNTSAITVYLVGPGSEHPFNQAFYAKSVLDIYSSPGDLPQEWRDLYFEKATARLIEHIHKESISPISALASPEQVDTPTNQSSSSASAAAVESTHGIGVVHIHGATIAFLTHFLAQRITAGAFDVGGRPGIVYTLHDYSDEVLYLNEAGNVDKFLDFPSSERRTLNQYRYGNEVFMSPLGINHADMVTFVSRSLTADLVEGRLKFHMKEIAMDAILTKARDSRFIGITNGIDLHARNPFASLELSREHLTFPRRYPEWPWSSASDEALIADKKQAAKKYLYRNKLLTIEDLNRPLILFIGRFQYNKGLEFFEETTEYLASRNARFVMMGQKNNYAHHKVVELRDQYPDNVLLIDEEMEQKRWGIYLRTAADFAFVPSRTESFGLVAAEGLLFGAAVISTGVGGLREFLVDRPVLSSSKPSSYIKNTPDLIQSTANNATDIDMVKIKQNADTEIFSSYNAYLFELDSTRTSNSLRRALNDAIEDFHRLRRDSTAYEAFLEGLVSSSVALGWDQKGGPVNTYNRVYAKAMERARKIPKGGLWR
jgi:glycogen synthase